MSVALPAITRILATAAVHAHLIAPHVHPTLLALLVILAFMVLFVTANVAQVVPLALAELTALRVTSVADTIYTTLLVHNLVLLELIVLVAVA